MIYAVSRPETNTFSVVDYDGRREEFRATLALLATGLGSPEATQEVLKEISTLARIDRVPYPDNDDNLRTTYSHARELLSEDVLQKVAEDIGVAFRDHRLTATEALAEMKLLDYARDEKVDPDTGLIDYNGLALTSKLGIYLGKHPDDAFVESTENYFSEDSPEGQLVEELGLTHRAFQHEIIYDASIDAYSMLSQREHYSLGYQIDGAYTPIVTVLNKNHPLRQAIEQQSQPAN